MKNIGESNKIGIYISIEIIISILVAIFVVPIIESESVWSIVIVSAIIIVNVIIFLGVLIVFYYKEVKSGDATSIIVKICAIFLMVFIAITAIALLIAQFN